MIKPSLSLIQSDVERALQEDVGNGDITALLLPEARFVSAEIISREPMVMCGQAWVEQTFATLDARITVEWQVAEGEYVEKSSQLALISGPVRAILTGERTALNFLQTLSATATLTRAYVLQLVGTQTILLDTRKTLPGLRHAQKYAVHCGGGQNHRMGLYDAFLIKENHIRAYGSIAAVIEQARMLYPLRFLEIEVQTLVEFQEALKASPDRILLDNFNHEMIMEAVTLNRPRKVPLEVSGGVQFETIRALAMTGIDFISVGSLTKSVHAIDLSLLIKDVV